MADDITQVTVHILDKDFLIACPRQEKEALLESARILDERVREIRNSGKVIGSDRIVVMAALNLAHELLQRQGGGGSPELERRLHSIQSKIESVLDSEDRQMRI